jgi:hypothetical protein
MVDRDRYLIGALGGEARKQRLCTSVVVVTT